MLVASASPETPSGRGSRRFGQMPPKMAAPGSEALGQLSPIVFNNIVGFKKLPFVFNNIVALMCSLLFLNDLVNAPRHPFGWIGSLASLGERRIAMPPYRPQGHVLEIEPWLV